MPETSNERKVFSLLEVTLSIQKTLAERYTSVFWVKAEINKLNFYPHSGHCYPDLVEKKDGKVIAQLRSTLWKDDYNRINHSFSKIVHTPLKDGIKVLLCARITFDPAHGLALRIMDIDPAFSLGELEREKQQTIETLMTEGIFTKNKSLNLAVIPQRIALISVQTSKGYADFLKVLSENPWNYKFFHLLFPSLLQGDRAAESIQYQLGRIRQVIHHFDVVAIVRGGGGDVGLSCFNDLNLSRQIARFPIPVITGIGHATNETVAEMIAFKNAITPTDLANFLIEKFNAFNFPLRTAEEKVVEKSRRIIRDQRTDFHHRVRYFRSVTENILFKSHHEIINNQQTLGRQTNVLIEREKEAQHSLVHRVRSKTLSYCREQQHTIQRFTLGLQKDTRSALSRKNHQLETIAGSIRMLSPINVLKRGYSITTINGKAITSHKEVKQNDVMKTLLADGEIISTVKEVNKANDHE
jgi:exodeoxyribonuclease VII large subunit